jgi:hypothetical protein
MISRRQLIDRPRRPKPNAELRLRNVDREATADLSCDLELNVEASRALKQVRELPVDQTKVIPLSAYLGRVNGRCLSLGQTSFLASRDARFRMLQ